MVKNPPCNAGDMGSILIWEDPTCQEAIKPEDFNYQADALQQEKPPQSEAWAPQLEGSPTSLQIEKACVLQQRPGMAKNT